MAGRNDIKAGRAFVELYLKNKLTAQLTQTLLNAKKTLNSLASAARFAGEQFNKLGSISFKVGGLITGPFLAALANLEEGKAMFQEMGQALTESLGRPLLPLLTTVRNTVLAFAEWAKRNPDLIRQVFLIGAGLTAAGVAFAALAGLTSVVAIGFSAAATAAGALAAVITALVTPVGAIGALLVAGVALWATWTESGRAAVQSVMSFFGSLFQTVREAIGGIGDALMAGDLTLAWKITVTGLHLLWEQGIDTMGALWDGFVAGVLQAFSEAVARIGQMWQNMLNTVKGGMIAMAVLLRGRGGAAGAAAADLIDQSRAGLDAATKPITTGLDIAKGVTATGAAIAKNKAETRNSDAVTKLTEELADLRKQAAEARAKAQSLGLPLPVLQAVSAPAAQEAMRRGQAATTTFSGTALLAAGQGGGPAKEIVKETKSNGKKLDKVVEVEQDLLKAVKEGAVFV